MTDLQPVEALTPHQSERNTVPTSHSPLLDGSTFDFACAIFGHLTRADQRRWAHAYLTSLLHTPGKKSVRRLAASVSESSSAAQSLHQFVNASPWNWEPAYRELMRFTERRLVPRAWALDVAIIRKRGEHSCGVHRRFIPDTGRSVNCQVGIGAFLVTGTDALPVGWRLLLPRTWTSDPQRRRRARIPEDAAPRSLDHHALELVGAMARHTQLARVPVIADLSEYSGTEVLVRGLGAGGHDFAVTVPRDLRFVAVRHPGPDRLQAYRPSFKADWYLCGDGSEGSRVESLTVLDRHGRPLEVRTALVRLAPPRLPDSSADATFRVLSVRPMYQRRRTELWLTNMVDRKVDEVIELTELMSRPTSTIRTMANDLGLLDFEGRSFPGWHHHMTMVSAAYAHARLSGPDRQLHHAGRPPAQPSEAPARACTHGLPWAE
ncbi:transposase [Streptomyces sp. NPDC052299]|uniref:IS701 family transposase n=1 Tax=Streptomyces sp. NPDC052299 TaxID=3155054 RepID=UPI00341B2CEB